MSDSSHNSPASTETFQPRATLRYTSAVGIQAACVGAVVSAVQNALSSHNHGAFGVFTRTGGTIGFFGAMGATFALTESVVANTREKDDALNGAAGGCAAGFLAGIRARSLPVAVIGCTVLGAAVGTFDYGGKNIAGGGSLSQEEKRNNFFKPTSLRPDFIPKREESS